MKTISFKAQDDLKSTLENLAYHKGINVSAFIKLLLTESLKKELNRVTENGITVAEELAILHADANDETYGPFKTIRELKKALSKPELKKVLKHH